MRIVILAAMDKEVDLLLPLLSEVKESEAEGVRVHQGWISGHDVCVMKCGIGKVNSALNAYRSIRYFKPDLVVNTGVAGGADCSMKVGSVLVATAAAYHDVWCGPGTIEGQIDGMPRRFEMDAEIVEKCSHLPDSEEFRFGLICTGDRFISTAEEVMHIKNIYPDALACDMESASIAHACLECGVACAVIRVVSDTPGSGDNLSQYANFWSEAPLKTFAAVRELLEILHNS